MSEVKCRACRKAVANWAWQPFGPGDTPDLFVLPGNHYRGFVVIKVCDACKRSFQAGNTLVFTYKHVLYKITKATRERHDLKNSWIKI